MDVVGHDFASELRDYVGGRFFEKTKVSTWNLYGRATYLNGNAYVAPLSTLFYKYNPNTDIWTTLAPIPEPLNYGNLVVVDDKIYAMNIDSDSKKIYMYNPNNNTWEYKTSFATKRNFFNTVSIGKNIYTIGGYDGSNELNIIEIYHTDTNTISTFPATLNTARKHSNAIAVDDKIYVFGGLITGNAATNTAEVIDTTNNTCSYIANMPTSTVDSAMGIIDNEIHIVGGRLSNSTTFSNTHFIYDKDTNSYTEGNAVPESEKTSIHCSGDNSIIIMGEVKTRIFSSGLSKFKNLLSWLSTR